MKHFISLCVLFCTLNAVCHAQIDRRPVDPKANDAYPQGNTDHRSNAANFQYLRRMYPNKMACLAECNSVPSWQNMQHDEALWLFVAPWCGGGAFEHGNTTEFWKEFMSADGVVAR